LKFLTPARFSGLWLHTEFRKLWSGQANSLLGTQFVNLALPLTAAIVLDASPIQMGVVTAMTGAPAFFGIFIGAWGRSKTKAADFDRFRSWASRVTCGNSNFVLHGSPLYLAHLHHCVWSWSVHNGVLHRVQVVFTRGGHTIGTG
jgi:hypothetical protein